MAVAPPAPGTGRVRVRPTGAAVALLVLAGFALLLWLVSDAEVHVHDSSDGALQLFERALRERIARLVPDERLVDFDEFAQLRHGELEVARDAGLVHRVSQ